MQWRLCWVCLQSVTQAVTQRASVLRERSFGPEILFILVKYIKDTTSVIYFTVCFYTVNEKTNARKWKVIQQENTIFYEALILSPWLLLMVKIITAGFPHTQCLATHETQMLQPTFIILTMLNMPPSSKPYTILFLHFQEGICILGYQKAPLICLPLR